LTADEALISCLWYW